MRNSKGQFIKGYKPLWTKESRKKVSETCKKVGVGKWMVGRKRSEETKRKISENSPKYWLGKKRPDMAGSKHPNWKEIKASSLHQSIRQSFGYIQWRIAVRKRDKATCVLCGIKRVYLEVDHYPKGFAELLREYGIKTLEQALSCKKLWYINNGRTLCFECHKKTANFAGKARKKIK